MEGGVIRQQKNTILKNVNIDIASGEFVYLIGKVGSGKSSFLPWSLQAYAVPSL